MAKNPEITCRILDIEAIPGTTAHLVSIEFSLGKRVWNRAFRLQYDRAISMEEFKRDLSFMDIIPKEPEDFLVYVKQEADKPFTIQVQTPLE